MEKHVDIPRLDRGVEIGSDITSGAEGVGMTQAEIEHVAREIRMRCLHSSWADLLDFWGSIVRDLEDAYRATMERTASYGLISSGDSIRLQSMVKYKLRAALGKLTGENRVARRDAEEAVEMKPLHAGGGDMLRAEGE